ncbi:unnamed protein product [Prorocentrum cordatum]|uniref:peptidylprolyl isomerase n=2 Tax=Prorocentrum cordatum TaxID=2364126 RepID=A0ABN9XKV5_9DINO|nr:unnamed protein product [Polarella glacialis]
MGTAPGIAARLRVRSLLWERRPLRLNTRFCRLRNLDVVFSPLPPFSLSLCLVAWAASAGVSALWRVRFLHFARVARPSRIMALRFHWSSIPISIVLSSLYFYYITRHKKGKPGGDFKKNKAFKDLDITVHQEAKSCTLKAGRGDLVHVHYTGYSKSSGKKFETTRSQSEPYVFKLGQCNDKDKPECLKGFEKSIFGMCAGEKRKVSMPPHLAYGKKGRPPDVGPTDHVTFHIELVDVDKA